MDSELIAVESRDFCPLTMNCKQTVKAATNRTDLITIGKRVPLINYSEGLLNFADFC